MLRKTISDLNATKQQIYALSQQTDVFQICDSNNVAPALNVGNYELIAGFGLLEYLPSNSNEAAKRISQMNKWCFGYLEYPKTYQTEFATSRMFIPKLLLQLNAIAWNLRCSIMV